MANKLLDLQDAITVQLAPLKILEFHLNNFIEEINLPEGGLNELGTICDALHTGIDNIEKTVKAS